MSGFAVGARRRRVRPGLPSRARTKARSCTASIKLGSDFQSTLEVIERFAEVLPRTRSAMP